MANALPGSDTSVLVQLLAATIEKQGQMLQAISDTNRNVERLATRIDGIEATLLRMSQGSLQVMPPLRTHVGAPVTREAPMNAGLPVAGPSQLPLAVPDASASGPHKEMNALVSQSVAYENITVDSPVDFATEDPPNNAHISQSEVATGTRKVHDASKKGRQPEQDTQGRQPAPTKSGDPRLGNASQQLAIVHPPSNSKANNSGKLPTATGNTSTASEHALNSDDDTVVLRKTSQPKRKRKLNNPPRYLPLLVAPSHRKESNASQPNPPTQSAISQSPPTSSEPASATQALGEKRKPEDAPAPPPQKRPRVDQRKLQCVVLIDLDTETRSRIRSAVPLAEEFVQDTGEIGNARQAASTPDDAQYETAFGSDELSDLTDIGSDYDDGDDDNDDSDPAHAAVAEDQRRSLAASSTAADALQTSSTLQSTPSTARGSGTVINKSPTNTLATRDGVKPPNTPRSWGTAFASKPGSSNPERLTIVISPRRRPLPPGQASSSASAASRDRDQSAKREPRPSPPLRMREDVKKDKAELELIPLPGIHRRLDGLEGREVKLEMRTRDVVVTRKFMSDAYGGNSQALFPVISPHKRASTGGHQHHLVYPTLKRNPEAPQVPGQNGLLCRALDTVPWDNPSIPCLKLMVGIGESMWGYMGDYVTEPAEPLSKEEWDSLSEKTKRTWAIDIATADKYIPLRSRIILRERLGREPTDDEVFNEAASIRTRLHGKSKKERPKPTEDEVQRIIQAYSSGAQRIYIWRFKCVGYDEAFQQEVVRKFSEWRRKGTVTDSTQAKQLPRAPRSLGPPPRTNPNDAHSGEPAPAPPAATRTAASTGDNGRAKIVIPARSRAPPPAHSPAVGASIPSPPQTPSPTREVAPGAKKPVPVRKPGWLLEDLRELFSQKREVQISDAELASRLFERRHGMREMRAGGRIDPHEYSLLIEFVGRHGRAWTGNG